MHYSRENYLGFSGRNEDKPSCSISSHIKGVIYIYHAEDLKSREKLISKEQIFPKDQLNSKELLFLRELQKDCSKAA